MKEYRVLIIGIVGVIIVIGMSSIVLVIRQAGSKVDTEQVNVLENSSDECVTCHRETSPGIIEQYEHSTMAIAEVTCRDCHEVEGDYPGAVAHEGVYILASPSTAMCERCHSVEVAQLNQSRHGLPAYVAYAGTVALNDELAHLYDSIPEGTYIPNQSRNAIAAMEGDAIVRFTCEGCHNIGEPAPDNSVGQCQKCHLRHRFSLEQARKPETCNACHIGPDHPQWEIFQESPHGIAYLTDGDDWHWEAEPGSLDVTDFPAPTCATCHMSGFGMTGSSHDVGDRLTWYLFAPISQRRPEWEANMERMQGVCLECHNRLFVDEFYGAADQATLRVNEWVEESNTLLRSLEEKNLLTTVPFDEPIDYTHFNIWHHWGRTTKFGVWMQGPDYAQWHGAYEVLHDMAELREMVEMKLEEAK